MKKLTELLEQLRANGRSIKRIRKKNAQMHKMI